ncbi:MAG: carbon starvation protein A [Cyclobacteriaceae bacterium]|nr:carbon starvation protein A [Cyclobacteriaceae bacterium]
MLTAVFIAAIVLFLLAYRFYGRFLDRHFEIDDNRKTPSHTDYDGVDKVPTKAAILLGHHFSSIAGAGPIVGPIIAAAAFGWVPALLWVVLGSIFIGGVHDFSALIASIRHKARSIAEIAREYMTPLSYKLFLVFIWLAMVYILIVFVDLTSSTFVSNGEVATSSLLFMLLAVFFGLTLYKLKLSLLWASLIFVPLVFLSVWIGQEIPLGIDHLPVIFQSNPGRMWNILLLIYAFIAAITPVWILLQPRDYLSSFLLYAMMLGAIIGIIFGSHEFQYPAFTTWSDLGTGTLFPILFITIACGACSGFHSIVASGTTSKQLNCETDTRKIGYGAMLIEGVVAVIALFSVAMLTKNDSLVHQPPLVVFGTGMGNFLSILGIPFSIGMSFGILAVSTFLLTTLDTSTRLARYILEELLNISKPSFRYISTVATLLLPLAFSLVTFHDANGVVIPAWKAIWPVFGATNQLLAGLALLVVYVWQKRKGKKVVFIALPMVFMLGMTLWALVQLIYQSGFSPIGVIAMVLLIALILVGSDVGGGGFGGGGAFSRGSAYSAIPSLFLFSKVTFQIYFMYKDFDIDFSGGGGGGGVLVFLLSAGASGSLCCGSDLGRFGLVPFSSPVVYINMCRKS